MAILRTRLVRRTEVAAHTVDMVFDLDDPAKLTFRAGQFVTLAVGVDTAGQTVRRSYSIASLSDRGESLRLLVRVIPGGMASEFLMTLPINQPLEMTGPHGFFVLAPSHPGDVLFAATGTGIAPVIPMLAELAARTESGRRFVYWGLRHEEDLCVSDEVQAGCDVAGAQLFTYLSRPSGSWRGARGRITAAVLQALSTLASPTFYLVGNGAMIAELKTGLVAAGIDRRKQIRTEAFFD